MTTTLPAPAGPNLSFTAIATTQVTVASLAAATSSLAATLTAGVAGGLTLEGWVNPASGASAAGAALFWLTAGSTTLSLTNPSNLTITLGASSLETGIALAAGVWQHVSLVVSAPAVGKVAVWLVVDAGTLYQAPAALAAPVDWLAAGNAQSVGLGVCAATAASTAATGTYAEFRLWSEALDTSLIVTDAYHQIPQGTGMAASGPLLVWSLDELPVGATATNVDFVAGSVTYRTETLTASWAPVTGATYNLNVYAADYSWSAIYQGLTATSQDVAGFRVDHGVSAVLQTAQSGSTSPWSTAASGQIFRLGVPLPEATAGTATGGTPSYGISWDSIDQAGFYDVTTTGQSAATVPVTTTGYDLSGFLGSAVADTITVAAAYGTVIGPGSVTADLDTPAPVLTYTVTADGQPGTLMLTWDRVPGATSYYVAWSATGTSVLPAQACIVGAGVTSFGPYPAAGIDGITYTAQVQALCAGGLSATATASVTVIAVTAPTGLSAITAPTAGAAPGEMTLSWDYGGANAALAAFLIDVAQDNGTYTTQMTSATTSVAITDPSFTTANWYTAIVRYCMNGVTGPAGSMTVYILPVPQNFSASWNPSASQNLAASYKAVTAPGVTANGDIIAYEVTVQGPVTGSDCAAVPADPSIDSTHGPDTSTTPSWSVSGMVSSDCYSGTVRTVVLNNTSSSVESGCRLLKANQAPKTDPRQPGTNDPVGIATGALTYAVTRLQQGAVVPIPFTTFYCSAYPTAAENSTIGGGCLGSRWRHYFQTCLIIDITQGVVEVVMGSMDMLTFAYSASAGELSPISPFQGTRLYRTDSGYELVSPDQTSWTFDATGAATAYADSYGNTLGLAYENSLLQSVSLSGGAAWIKFYYDGNNCLQTVTSSGGQSLTIQVDGDLLKTVTVPDIGTWQYFYADNGVALLEQIVDPWHNTEVFNQYDGSGRVTRQYTADGYAADPQYSTQISYGTATWQGQACGTTTVVQPDGGTAVFSYDPNSLIIFQKSTALGTNVAGEAISEIVVIEYDGYYQPVGSTLYLGPTASYEAGRGNTTSFTYNSNRLMSRATDPAEKFQAWDYDDANNLLAYTDIWGNVTTYTYAGGNLRHTEVNAMGQTTSYEYWDTADYGFSGLVKTVADPFGNVTEIDYASGTGLLQTVTAPDGTGTGYTYDAEGRPYTETVTAAAGTRLSATASVYDNLGRPTSFTVEMGSQSATDAYVYSYSYDSPTPNTVIVTYPADAAGTYAQTIALNGDRKVATLAYQVFDGVAVTRTTGYDKNGRVASMALGSHIPTTYTYNALDDMIAVTDPLGRTRTMATQQVVDNSDGPYRTQTVVTWPTLTYPDAEAGTVTTYLYTETTGTDPSGLVVSKTLTLAPSAAPDTPVWQQTISWDYATATVAATDPVPAYQALTVTQTTTPAVPSGPPVTTAQTQNGTYLTVSSTDGRGYATNISYAPAVDPAGSTLVVLKQTVAPPAGASIDLYVDPSGNHIARAAGTGQAARAALYGYDALGRLTQVRVGDTLANLAAGNLTAQGAAQTTFAYQFDNTSGVGRMRVDTTQPVDDTAAAATVAVSTLYDAFNQVVAETFADGGTYSRTYAPWGSVGSWSLPSGGGIGFGFDDAGWLTTVTPTDSGQITHELDEVGNRLKTLVGGTPAIERGFDEWNRLISRTADGATIQQSQWPNGLLRTLTYPDGKTVDYSLDGFGRWQDVTDWADRTTRYAYLATGQLSSITLPNGTLTSYGYNPAGAVTSFSVTATGGGIVTDLLYTPNDHNEPGSVSGFWPLPPILPVAATSLTYTNDTLADYDGTALSSNADAALTQIPGTNGSGAPVEVGYLPYGPLQTVGATTYTYDADGMLTGRGDGGTNWSFTVAPNAFQDPLLNMGSAARTAVDALVTPTRTAGRTLLPVYGGGDVPPGIDQALDLVLQVISGTTVQTHYVHGLGPLCQEQADGTALWFHADPSGNMVVQTDEDGNPAVCVDYGPYGDIRARSGTPTPTPFYGFAGRFGVIDDGSGLLAMRARFYSPTLMRFTARDLLAGNAMLPTARNRYVYGADNPLVYTDPLGLNFFKSLSHAASSMVASLLGAGRKLLIAAAGAAAATAAAGAAATAFGISSALSGTPAGYDPLPTDEGDADRAPRPNDPDPDPDPVESPLWKQTLEEPEQGLFRRSNGGRYVQMTNVSARPQPTSPRTPEP
jgi:RHS repeat-associated protein